MGARRWPAYGSPLKPSDSDTACLVWLNPQREAAMSASVENVYTELCSFARETALLESVESVLQWDERTYMPPDAAEFRAEQLTYLAGQAHRRRTDARIGQWLGELAGSSLAADRHGEAGTTIRQLQRDFERQSKL